MVKCHVIFLMKVGGEREREREFNGGYAAPQSFHFASASIEILHVFQRSRKQPNLDIFAPNKIQPFK